jgi:glucose-6-phosphate 1-dehydrogenase
MEKDFLNPLDDHLASNLAEPCVLVIFGATGDLTAKKLVPALYDLSTDGLLPSHFACVGFARRDKTNEQFREEMHNAVSKYARNKPIQEDLWRSFSEQILYHRSEFGNDQGYISLKEQLKELDKTFGTKGNRIYYLSTPPSEFAGIIEMLRKHDLIYAPSSTNKFSRVLIEKPFGHDVATAVELQKNIAEVLSEEQIYRIDHYLGKETVQNLLVLRFSNPVFETTWSHRHIDSIQITVGEDVGVGTRGRFFEEAGTLRDIIQNHMMQLLCLVGMEPPVSLMADAIRDEKVKVLSSLRPITKERVDRFTVRGQYGAGYIQEDPVKSYRQEDNVSPTSHVETFVAMEVYIDNWRWSGVPFYLRTGKRLPKRTTEIAVFFKEAPGSLFKDYEPLEKNVLVFRIQPEEGLSLKINSKVPGSNFALQPIKMSFKYSSFFGSQPPDAYERLLIDCMMGDQTLFARKDEVMASWAFLQPILDHWRETVPTDFPNYPSGSWGPEAANALLNKEGRKWRLV